MNLKHLMTIAAVGVAALGGAAPALANNLFTLDSSATGPARLVEDPSGTADVAWLHADASNNDHVMFCRIPRGGTCTSQIELPQPPGFSPDGALPLLSGSTLYVIVPDSSSEELEVYTSTNGGTSFDSGHEESYPGEPRQPSAVVRDASGKFAMSADGTAVVTYDTFTATGSTVTDKELPIVPGDEVAGSSLALANGSPVESYWTVADGQSQVRYFNQSGSTWSGPLTVGAGYEAKLSGGASGTFLLSQDYAGGLYPSAVNVRKYDGSGFAPPVTLANDPNVDLFSGGAIAQSPSGRVDVAWPEPRPGDNAFVMRLYSSTDGGSTYAETDVARLPDDYLPGDNAQLAVADDGSGWLTYNSKQGQIAVADLTPIAPYVPPVTTPPVTTPTPAPYAGATKTASASVGRGLSVTLRLPKSCVAARQQFTVFVGTKVKHKLAKGKHLAVKKVVFAIDGHTVKTLERGPFTLRTALTTAGTHAVTAKVTVAIRHGKHRTTITKTLKGRMSLC